MNVKDYAKENNLTQDEVKAKFGLNHWNQQVPDDEAVEPVTETPDVVITVPVTKTKKATTDDEGALKEARGLQGLLGSKTRAYLVYVNDNKNKLPLEYVRAQHLIERYVCDD